MPECMRGWGGLADELAGVWQSAKSAAQRIASSLSIKVQSGVGALTTSGETTLDGQWAVKPGAQLGGDVAGAEMSATVKVGESGPGSLDIEASKPIGKIGPAKVEVTTTVSVNPNNPSDKKVTKVGLKVGVGIPNPIPSPVSVSKDLVPCFGPGCTP
jgi:hypothetical protein